MSLAKMLIWPVAVCNPPSQQAVNPVRMNKVLPLMMVMMPLLQF
jgi:hypothetical protein